MGFEKEGRGETDESSHSQSGGNGDEVKVVAREGSEERVYVGIEVSRGPAVLHLILSRPYDQAATTVDIPLSEVVSIEKVPHLPQGIAPGGIETNLESG